MKHDVLGWRKKFGVIGPSTNTVVQPDMEMMRPPGVTNHYRGIFTPNAKALSNDIAYKATLLIAENVADAVKNVMTCEPDHLVMGMSAVTFFGGKVGAHAFRKQVEDIAGIGVSTGAISTAAGLKAYGSVKRIAFFSPYYPKANAEVAQYFTDEGFEVVREIALEAKSWTDIATITPDVCRETLKKLDGPDVDAIVQVGTNLSMVRLAAAAEAWLNKPVVAINTATYWHALRANGIEDKIHGLGRLLAEF
jgi:maleate isomerase